MEILKDFSPIVYHEGNLGELKLVLSAIEPSLRRYGHCPRVEKTINNNPLDSRPACRSRGATTQGEEIFSKVFFFFFNAYAFWRYIYSIFVLSSIVCMSFSSRIFRENTWALKNRMRLHYIMLERNYFEQPCFGQHLFSELPTLPLPACFADLLSTWSLQLPCVLHKL